MCSLVCLSVHEYVRTYVRTSVRLYVCERARACVCVCVRVCACVCVFVCCPSGLPRAAYWVPHAQVVVGPSRQPRRSRWQSNPSPHVCVCVCVCACNFNFWFAETFWNGPRWRRRLRRMWQQGERIPDTHAGERILGPQGTGGAPSTYAGESRATLYRAVHSWTRLLTCLWWKWLGIDLFISASLVEEIPLARATLDLADFEEEFAGRFGSESD